MNLFETIAPVATVVSGITAGVIIVSDDDRIRLGMLALQYTCVTSLVSLTIPFKVAVIKLVAGLLACTVLGITMKRRRWYAEKDSSGALPTGWVFRIIAVLLVSTSAIGIGQIALFDVLRIPRISVASTMLMIGLGLLFIGLTEEPFGVGIGLLTIISGFEILYSTLEPSLAVMALLASIHIGISLAVSIITLDVKGHEDLEVLE